MGALGREGSWSPKTQSFRRGKWECLEGRKCSERTGAGPGAEGSQ